ncbi:hypothetical protein KKH23_10620 [Patescibacteria group bacterium]|nr:hypothetical protein [Patescibacteria group bacterium]
MTKQELIDVLKTKFTEVLEANIRDSGIEGDLRHWAVPVIDVVGDVIIRQWVHFYENEATLVAYWQDKEPKPSVVPEVSFAQKVQSFIAEKVGDGTIKFAFVEQSSPQTKKALITAITPTGAEKKAIITETENGDFSIEILA